MKRLKRLAAVLVLAALVAVGLSCLPSTKTAYAANPTTMSFQGKVVNADGTNVADGTYSFVFKLYTVSSGGSALWTETDGSVTVAAGVFQVNLGANCPLFVANACNGSTPVDFNANPNLFLGITFNSDPAGEMTPRVQLQSSPYAFNSDKVGGLTAAQLVQLSPGSQQTGFVNVSGNITSGATIQGGTLDGTTGINTGAAGGTQRIDNTGNLLNIGTITGTSALAVASGGTAQNLTLDGATTGKVQIAATSSGDVELGGGVASGSGCTLTNTNGNWACTGSVAATNGLKAGSTTTAGSIVLNDGTVSGNTVTLNTPTLTGPYSITLPSTGPAVSQCLQTDPTTASQLVFGDCYAIGQKLTQTFNTYAINQAATATTAMNFLLPTGAAAFAINIAGTLEFKAAAAGSFRACSIVNSAVVTAGSVSIRFRKNGANVSTNNYCTLNTTNTRTNSEQVAPGVETFAAGDTIGIALVSTGLAPATSEHWATFTIEYGAGGVGATSLQDAYANGNSVTTVNASDLDFNLANTATDSNFLVNIATGSTGRFAVQNNGVDALSVDSTGNLVTTGTVNGATLTGGTLSATAVNLLFVSGTAITGTGALAVTAGGAAQNLTLNGTTTGQVLIGGTSTGDILLGGGSLATGCTVTNGTGAFACTTSLTGTSVVSPSLTTTGALTINSGAANNITIDSAGAGTAAINIGGTNTTSLALSRTGQTTTVNGALVVNQSGTFNSNVIMTFAGTENLAITSDLAGTVNGISFIGTPSATAGTTNGAFIQQAASANANGLDSGLTIDNANATVAIGAAINITSTGAGGYTNYITSPNFILTGTGQVEGKGFNYFDPSTLTQATGATGLNGGGTTGGNFGGAFDGGAFIENTDTADQEFIASLASATTNNRNVGDNLNWYFNNNAQTTVTSTNVSTTGGFFRMTVSAATTGRGGLIAEGATPGTLDAPLIAANLPIVQMKVRPSLLNTQHDLIWGMGDTATAPVANDPLPTNGIFFWTNNGTGATGWQGVVRSGGANVGTVTCPGTVTVNQFATGRIVVVNATTVRFFIDNNASDGVNLLDCGTVTGTLPAANFSMEMFFSKTVAAGTPTFDLDYARFWQDDSPPADTSEAADTSQSEQLQADLATSDGTDDSTALPSDVATAGTDGTSTTGSPEDAAPSPTVADSQPQATPDGSSQLLDSSGSVVATVDASANVSFSGNLNLVSANLSGGLNVGGDSNFAGLSTFQKLATFLGKTIFRQDVQFDGHVTVAKDSAGYASLRKDESSVHVAFTTPYDNPPIVSLGLTDGQFAEASVDNVTTKGFDIKLQAPATADTTLSWVAIGVNDPQTATNPLPLATSSD